MSERAHSLWLQRDSACRTCLLPLRIFCRSHALCILGYDAEQLPLPQIIAGCAGCNGSSRIRLDGVRARWFQRLSTFWCVQTLVLYGLQLDSRASMAESFAVAEFRDSLTVRESFLSLVESFPACRLLFPIACCLPFVMLHCLKLESRASIG